MAKKESLVRRRKKRRNPEEITDEQVKRRLVKGMSVEDLSEALVLHKKKTVKVETPAA